MLLIISSLYNYKFFSRHTADMTLYADKDSAPSGYAITARKKRSAVTRLTITTKNHHLELRIAAIVGSRIAAARTASQIFRPSTKRPRPRKGRKTNSRTSGARSFSIEVNLYLSQN